MQFRDRNDPPCDLTGNQRCGTRITSVKWTTGHGAVDNRALHGKSSGGGKSKSSMLKLCTWNVRGLNIVGKLQILETSLEKIGIAGIAETHWRRSGHFLSSNGNLIICSSNEQQSANGVAITVNNTLKDNILGYETVNDRILLVRFDATPV